MTVRNLKIDDSTGDLVVTSGQLLLISDGDSIKQAVRARLRTLQGEWFLDTTLGVPYEQQVLVKNPNIPALSAVFRSAIETVDGVDEVTELSLNFDAAERTLEVTFKASTDTGELIADTVEA